jgi:transposase
VRDGTLSFNGFGQEIIPIRRRITQALADSCFALCNKTAGCCKMLIQEEAKMWTFAKVEGVEPTTNAAERALRKAAIWRRIMLGTQSESGNRFVESILTVWETCRKQGRNSYEFLRKTFQATGHHKPIPSLVKAGA